MNRKEADLSNNLVEMHMVANQKPCFGQYACDVCVLCTETSGADRRHTSRCVKHAQTDLDAVALSKSMVVCWQYVHVAHSSKSRPNGSSDPSHASFCPFFFLWKVTNLVPVQGGLSHAVSGPYSMYSGRWPTAGQTCIGETFSSQQNPDTFFLYRQPAPNADFGSTWPGPDFLLHQVPSRHRTNPTTWRFTKPIKGWEKRKQELSSSFQFSRSLHGVVQDVW